MLWSSWSAAINRPRFLISEPRLGFSPRGRTWNWEAPSNLCTSLSPPHLPDLHHLRANFQGSFRRTLRGLRTKDDDPNAPPLIFGGVLEEGTHPPSQTPLTYEDGWSRRSSGLRHPTRCSWVHWCSHQWTQQNNCCAGSFQRGTVALPGNIFFKFRFRFWINWIQILSKKKM